MVAHTYNYNTWEVEAEESGVEVIFSYIQVSGQLGLYETLLKNKRKKKKKEREKEPAGH